MAQTIRRNAKPVRRQARAQASRTKVRKAKARTNSLIDALMRVLPFTEEQLHKAFLVLILAAAAAIAWLVASLAGLPALAGQQLAFAAADAGYEVSRVEVRGVERMNELKVYERVLGEKERAMPLVDLHALRGSLMELPWVEDARVSRQLPDTIVVDIVEREPHAVLRRPDRLVLIDRHRARARARFRGRCQGHAADFRPRRARAGRGAERAARRRPGAAPASERRRMGRQPALEPDFQDRPGARAAAGRGGIGRRAYELRPARRASIACSAARSRHSTCATRTASTCACRAAASDRTKRKRKLMAAQPRIARVFGAVNIGSFRISAMIAGLTESGEMIVLGSGHRAAQGIKRGYITDMAAATYAVRDAIERAEKLAGISVASVWIGCSGAGLASRITPVEIEIGGRRIEEEDIEHLLVSHRAASSLTGGWCCTPSRRATSSTAPKASPIPRASMPSGSASTSTSCSPTARRCAI